MLSYFKLKTPFFTIIFFIQSYDIAIWDVIRHHDSDSLAKNNFVRATFQKFGVVCDCIRKNTQVSRNCCIIYLKSKHFHEHCIHNESWLNNKKWKSWHLFVSAFISLLLLIMFFTIFFVCHRHLDPNRFPYLLHMPALAFVSLLVPISPKLVLCLQTPKATVLQYENISCKTH